MCAADILKAAESLYPTCFSLIPRTFIAAPCHFTFDTFGVAKFYSSAPENFRTQLKPHFEGGIHPYLPLETLSFPFPTSIACDWTASRLCLVRRSCSSSKVEIWKPTGATVRQMVHPHNENTVDGSNPEPVGKVLVTIYSVSINGVITGKTIYQLVRDFFNPQYHGYCGSTMGMWCLTNNRQCNPLVILWEYNQQYRGMKYNGM